VAAPENPAAVALGRLITAGERVFLALLAILMAAFYALCAYNTTAVINGQRMLTFGDDIYISMRYAQHLISGHGLVWNVGERPIEGFTNFLWTLWIALLTTIRRDPSYLMVASAAALHIAAVVVFHLLLRRTLHVAILPAVVATALLGVWVYVQAQVIHALEGPLILFLFLASLFLLLRAAPDTSDRYPSLGALLAGVLPLVRPDGLFLTFLLATVYVATPAKANRRPRHITVAVLLFFAPVALMTAFRSWYFGDLLPNTFYLKVLGRPGRIEYGIAYVTRFFESFYGTLLLVPLLFWSAWQRMPTVRIAAVGVIGVLAYVAYQGGDFVDSWRFMIAVLPLFLILFAVCVTQCLRTARFNWVGISLCALLVVLWARETRWAISMGWPPSSPVESTADNIRLGLFLKAVCSSDAVAADSWAGATPYYSELSTIDMLGRSDRWIARRPAFKAGGTPGHDKFDTEYVLSRRPDVIISTYRVRIPLMDLEAAKKSEFVFGAYLLDSLAADTNYVPIDIPISRTWHGIYARRDSAKCAWEQAPHLDRIGAMVQSASRFARRHPHPRRSGRRAVGSCRAPGPEAPIPC
jgi:arabinofuranosyltransferase